MYFPIDTLRRVLELSCRYPEVELTSITGENKTRTDAKRALAFIEAKLWPEHHKSKKLSLSWLEEVIVINSSNRGNSSDVMVTPVKGSVPVSSKRLVSPVSSTAPSSTIKPTTPSADVVSSSRTRQRRSAWGVVSQAKEPSGHVQTFGIGLLPPDASSFPLSTTSLSTCASFTEKHELSLIVSTT